MGGIRLSFHPLFFPLGLYYAFTGRIFLFFIYTLSALVHEVGHSIVAGELGYKLNKIILMPFGAVVKGDIRGLNLLDQIKIAVAGPLINLFIVVLFVASWWVYPEGYPFTQAVVEANLSMAIVNFLPVYPLDGGRIIYSALGVKLGRERAFKITTASGVIFIALLLTGFAISVKKGLNLSLLFFALFLVFGLFGRERENKYVKIYTSIKADRLKKGLPVRRFAIEKSTTIKGLVRILQEGAINEVVVYDKDKKIATLSQEKINSIVEKGEYYSKIERYIRV